MGGMGLSQCYIHDLYFHSMYTMYTYIDMSLIIEIPLCIKLMDFKWGKLWCGVKIFIKPKEKHNITIFRSENV